MSRSSEAAGRRLYFSTALSSSPSACVRLFTSGTTESFSQLKCRATDKGMGGGTDRHGDMNEHVGVRRRLCTHTLMQRMSQADRKSVV